MTLKEARKDETRWEKGYMTAEGGNRLK